MVPARNEIMIDSTSSLPVVLAVTHGPQDPRKHSTLVPYEHFF